MNKKVSKIKKAILVYQAGIANVFRVEQFGETAAERGQVYRLMQDNFHSCESFARGLACAGVIVETMACNKAGDIINEKWSNDLENQPFSYEFNPINA